MGQSSGVESHGYQAGPLDPAVHPIPLYYVDYVGFVVYNVLESHEYQPKLSVLSHCAMLGTLVGLYAAYIITVLILDSGTNINVCVV